MLHQFWSQFIFDLHSALSGSLSSVMATGQVLQVHFSIISILDLILVFALLWWVYRKLRRTDLMKILPRLIFLLIITLIAHLFGLWALYYVTGFLLFSCMVAIGAMYAPEIKQILEVRDLVQTAHKSVRATTGDLRGMIKTITEAAAVLTRAHKPALIMIRTDKPVTRLIENGTKLHSKLTLEFLVELFSGHSELSRGAVILDGDRVVAAGSTLLRAKAKILFNPGSPEIRQAIKETNAVGIVLNKTFGDITLLVGEQTYKNLTASDLDALLSRLLVDKNA